MKYHKAEFDRGTGLGNRMFPWARAIIAAEQSNEKTLRPKWENIRLAPIKARNINLSDLAFKFFLINNFHFRISLPSLYAKHVIVHRGLKNYFSDLAGYEDILYTHFLQQSKFSNSKVYYQNIAKLYPIMVNLRTGNDFGIKYNPSFFLDMINQIRKETREDIGVAVITDSYDNTLMKIFEENNCVIVRNKKAVDDLYLLSLASTIIGSGGSSFCCWPAFFKRIPLLVEPETPHDYFQVFSKENRYLLMQKNKLEPKDLQIINKSILKKSE